MNTNDSSSILLSDECEALESMNTFISFCWVVISKKGRRTVFLFTSFSKMTKIHTTKSGCIVHSYMIISMSLLSYAGDDTNNLHFNAKETRLVVNWEMNSKHTITPQFPVSKYRTTSIHLLLDLHLLSTLITSYSNLNILSLHIIHLSFT